MARKKPPARYKLIYQRLWRHPAFLALSFEEKVLAFNLLTGTQVNRCGLYHFSLGMASEETGIGYERFKEVFQAVLTAMEWQYDKESRVVFIPSWWRWNPPANQNVLKSCLADLKELPSTPLMEDFKQTIGTLRETLQQTFAETLGVTIPERMRHQEQEHNHNHIQEHKQETPPSPPRDGDASPFSFACVDGATWSLGESLLAKLAEAYPAVDVPAEAAKAVAWCETHTDRLKEPDDMPAFFNAWLERNSRRSEASPTPAPASGRRTARYVPQPPPANLDEDRKEILKRIEEKKRRKLEDSGSEEVRESE